MTWFQVSSFHSGCKLDNFQNSTDIDAITKKTQSFILRAPVEQPEDGRCEPVRLEIMYTLPVTWFFKS